VIDWAHQHPSGELLPDEIVISTSRRCIDIAVALGLKSIAFTPWGTRIGAMETSRVTALMVQAITASLQNRPGSIEIVYLVSHQQEHYQWFVDRTFVFQVMYNQIALARRELNELNLPQQARDRILGLLGNLQNNILIYNETVGGDKLTTRDITNSTDIAIGRSASVISGDV
jgi:hypothetical protein